MATRLEHRTSLKNKLLGLEDGGYGDFEYSDIEYDTYLDLAVARLFPAIYKKDSVSNLTVISYGTAGAGYVESSVIPYERVFLVEDSTELTAVANWESRATRVMNINMDLYNTVNVYFTSAFALPEDELTDDGIPSMYFPLINLGALIEALESRQDTGVRGEPAPTGPFYETGLLDRLKPRYDQLRSDLSMSLPGVRF